MPETETHKESLQEPLRPSEADVESPRGRPGEAEEGRTLATGRAFVSALAVDLWALLRRLGRAFQVDLWALLRRSGRAFRSAGPTETRASPRIGRKRSAARRAIGGLAKMLAVVIVLGSVTTVGAMFWALHDLPPEKSIASNGEGSFLVEAADGSTL